MPIIPFIMTLIKALAIARVVKLLCTLALIAWFFNYIAVPESMLHFEWPLKAYFAPLFGALGIKQAFAMISAAYTARWTFEAIRLALH